MQIQKIKLAQLAPNTGQIPGLPSNPRQWTKSDVDRIAKSLAETPELFEARPIIAYPFDGKFVILGGNLRYEGARKNKDTEAPVIVLPEDTPADKLKEIVIKDNGSFGAWDYDALANEWDDLPLGDWGVPAWETTEQKEPINSELDVDGFDEKVTISFALTIEEHAFVQQRLGEAGGEKEQALLELLGYGESE